MAEEIREASGTATGLTGTEESQPSGAQGTTSPQSGEAVQFDTKQRYQNPANPDETITAAELRALVNQGKMFRDAQSARDKAVAAMQQHDAVLADVKQRAEKAEAQVQQMQIDQKVIEQFKAAGITNDGKKEETDWGYTGEAADETALTPDMVLRRVEEVAKQQVAGMNLKESATDIVKRVLADERAEEESQKRVAEFVTRARKVKAETLETELPDIPTTARDKILNLQDQVGQLDSIARDLVKTGDLDRADEAWAESQGRDAEALRLRTTALIEQQTLSAEKQRREEIEMLSKGGPELTKTKKRTKKWLFGKEAEESANAKYEEAKAMETRIAQLKNY